MLQYVQSWTCNDRIGLWSLFDDANKAHAQFYGVLNAGCVGITRQWNIVCKTCLYIFVFCAQKYLS